MTLYNETKNKITGLNKEAMEDAQKRLDYLLKPKGSLGTLESIAKQLAGITGKINNDVSKRAIIAMCSDNGIYEEGVSSYPQEVSTLVAGTMCSGLSGVAVLARHAKAKMHIIDIGLKENVECDVASDKIIIKKIRKGTDNFIKGPAMTRDETLKAIEIGIEETNKLINEEYNMIGTGEVGIANTTTSSAILYAFTGESLDLLVGRGAGLSDEGLEKKKDVIKNGIQINKPDVNDPIDVLSKVGGFDIAGLVGVYLACAAKKIPVVIDGFISGVAAVTAFKINPLTVEYMIPSHITDEPGGKIINSILGKEAMLNMHMRLGEGTGCALAFHIIEAATKMMNEMGTFGDIGM